jgi:hypothetical protein
MIIVLFLILLCFLGPADAQDDCICPAEIIGPQTPLSALTEVKEHSGAAAANSLDGSYFIGWQSSTRLSKSEEATIIQGQIFDKALQPISPMNVFENNPRHEIGDLVYLGGVVFNPNRREYFIVTANVAFTSTGTKYTQLKGHILSDQGLLKISNIIIADSRARPGLFLGWSPEVIFNSVNHEYAVHYSAYFGGQQRSIVQTLNEDGNKRRKVVFARSGTLRFNFHANQYLFASSRFAGGKFEIHAQLLNAQLKRIGPLNTVLVAPYIFPNGPDYYGPFPVYNPTRRKFVIFWSEGTQGKLKIFERSLSSDGRLDPLVDTGIFKRIYDIRFNPATEGYILISLFPVQVIRVDRSYRITSRFSFTCQKPPFSGVLLVYNRFHLEFLSLWTYPIAYGKNMDLYGQRLAASIPDGACN